jgi:hypothetical protein
MKHKKWVRTMLAELTQISGQNSDVIAQHQRAASEFVQRIQSAANDIRRAMTPEWLVLTSGTKVDVHDISSVELDESPHPSVWRVRMKNGADFTIPVDEVSEYATKHPAFSI